MSEASAPASSANLGPGFDTLALALDVRCTVTAERSESWKVLQSGSEVAATDDAIIQAAMVVTREPLSLIVTNDIPIGRGLGSSAAARAAVIAASMLAVGVDVDPNRVFSDVTKLEGHPDNAAAATFGGLVSVTTDGGVVPLELAPHIELVVAVPDETLPTTLARSVLADRIDRAASIRSLQRLSALLEGLRTGDARVLRAASGDELHEAPRTHLNPLASPLMSAAREAGALHVCWSGAGPSVLAFTDQSSSGPVAAAMSSVLDGNGTVMRPQVDRTGLRY